MRRLRRRFQWTDKGSRESFYPWLWRPGPPALECGRANLRHDSHTLAVDARALLDATAHIADQAVADARQRLTEALESSRDLRDRIQERAVQAAKATDKTIRENPYQSIGIAFGVGALIGFLLARK